MALGMQRRERIGKTIVQTAMRLEGVRRHQDHSPNSDGLDKAIVYEAAQLRICAAYEWRMLCQYVSRLGRLRLVVISHGERPHVELQLNVLERRRVVGTLAQHRYGRGERGPGLVVQETCPLSV
ncbi:uncharacterized protein PHACADRAFT_253111 [Phanerochaete carnosa HHB-10118-sp]|uniref:Uncharacterized protein n=1 Tax=Phanerochaete carnosa (strain HHB-10118-sp) TaxID=650164 RepID=K5W415_PHACS|nr:uncharacterized protein PHACADRAFT_253111 [Phanerochaete carnosa HHB-10118-sp]EKM58638.1 hypothetical protein PHACADRAFT_253111 [Phanerochaete carnosa HHB-10118-sp]